MERRYYCPSYNQPKGFALVPRIGNYQHRFGGESWKVIDETPFFENPSLLFTLDLRDPRLAPIKNANLGNELPLCSYINSTVMHERQFFEVIPSQLTVKLISKCITKKTTFDNSKYKFPVVLPERLVDLRELKDSEYPVDRDSYEHCLDELNCGEVFCRVLGEPIFYDDRESTDIPLCFKCADEMMHVLTIGSETVGRSDFIPGDTLYFGDLYLHFYYCGHCLIQAVTGWSLITSSDLQ